MTSIRKSARSIRLAARAAAPSRSCAHRRADGEGGALAGQGLDVYAPAEDLDVPLYDVQADAAARKVRDRVGGGEAGGEDQVADLGVREPGTGLDDPVGDSLLQDPV